MTCGMKMLPRTILGIVVSLAWIGKAVAAPPPPAIVLQVTQPDQLLAKLPALLRSFASAEIANELQQPFDQLFGEELQKGLNLKKPAFLYMQLPEKLAKLQFEPAGDDPDMILPIHPELEQIRMMLVIPVGSREAFEQFLAQFFGMMERQTQIREVENNQGLYRVLHPDHEFEEFPTHLRYQDGYAYVGMNTAEEKMDVDKLVPVSTLHDKTEKADLALRLEPMRFAATFGPSFLEMFDDLIVQLRARTLNAPGPLEALALDGLRVMRGFAELFFQQTERVTLRYRFDEPTKDHETECILVPKPKSALAALLAARPATENRLAGLIPDEAIFGGHLRLPLFEGLREGLVRNLPGFLAPLRESSPTAWHSTLAALETALAKTITAGSCDVALTLVGPNAAGHYTALAGITLEDAPTVLAAFRKSANDAKADDPLRKRLTFDSAPSRHRLKGDWLLSPAAGKPFGGESLEFAVGPDRVLLGIGPDLKTLIPTALATKPRAAAVTEFRIHPLKMDRFLVANDEDPKTKVAQHYGDANKSQSILRITLEGGSQLTAKCNLRPYPFMRVTVDKP
ncbi:MAG: hypothetical protein ACRCZF_07280 [Gemmataceae bacterium]